jgi:hypothetical protein
MLAHEMQEQGGVAAEIASCGGRKGGLPTANFSYGETDYTFPDHLLLPDSGLRSVQPERTCFGGRTSRVAVPQ